MDNGQRKIQKLLVCNRGEIAIRIFRACAELGIGTVAIFSDEDRFSLHRYKADEAYQIGGPGNPVRNYLDVAAVIAIAKQAGADAIHPGYGFLSERFELHEAATQAGIIFVGPDANTLRVAGDKVATLALAKRIQVPTVPGSERLDTVSQATAFAHTIGYPVILKASFGGGGRGMRVARSAPELEQAFLVASSEAEAAFGRKDIYLEKYVERPKHIEVQLLGDGQGEVVHLYERDCSVQRRHQKVIEFAPAVVLSENQKQTLYGHALSLGRALHLRSAATAEFLVAGSGEIYFIEINPRIQVEHTVTEEITGIDLVQSQIRIAGGATLKELNLTQEKISPHGVALQCRVTTEDPANGFTPDTGKLLTYRSASGFGIRLDAGSAFTGAVISPYYDSLLVKVTARGRTLDEASRKLRRCLREFRIRGVKTNIQFLERLLQHPSFLSGEAKTALIDETSELFEFTPRRDRANKILRFLAEITVNGHASMPKIKRPLAMRDASVPTLKTESPPAGWKQVFEVEGKKAFLEKIKASHALLITDTTMRDAHQSLLATRMRTYDMHKVARALATNVPELFSLEMWGGATFDVCYRFLKEDPWERLAALREAVPNILFQMLLRGANVVGYKNYPSNVVRTFTRESRAAGMDIFRVFDCFNNVAQMRVAIDAVQECGGIAEACLCYTGDLLAEEEKRKAGQPVKFDLSYYAALAEQCVAAGADLIAIKDMAGLLRPYAAELLVRKLRQVVDVPIHFHTHDTAGGQIAAYLKAAEAGVHIVDCAISSMSGVTSQPCLEGVVAALAHTPRNTGLDLEALTPFGSYWETVRGYYAPFESDLRAATGEVYLNEIPGGQYSNFRPQAASLGLADRWEDLKRAYREVNRLLGGVVKVTPSSKAIGDFAIFMVANNLSPEDVVSRADELNFPASVVELFQGELGEPYGGFPDELQKKILRGKPRVKDATGASLPDADLNQAEKAVQEAFGRAAALCEAVSYVIYPHVLKEFGQAFQSYGDVSILPTSAYLYGLREGEEIVVDLEPGKRLFITLVTVTDADEKGERTVIFELNGQARSIALIDKKVAPKVSSIRKIDPANPKQIGAPLSGALVAIDVREGDVVTKDTKLLTIEAMKMQTVVKAPLAGTIKRVVAKVGTRVDTGELMLEFE